MTGKIVAPVVVNPETDSKNAPTTWLSERCQGTQARASTSATFRCSYMNSPGVVRL